MPAKVLGPRARRLAGKGRGRGGSPAIRPALSLASVGRLALVVVSLLALVILAVALTYRAPVDGQGGEQGAALGTYHGPGCAYLHGAVGAARRALGSAAALVGPWL